MHHIFTHRFLHTICPIKISQNWDPIRCHSPPNPRKRSLTFWDSHFVWFLAFIWNWIIINPWRNQLRSIRNHFLHHNMKQWQQNVPCGKPVFMHAKVCDIILLTSCIFIFLFKLRPFWPSLWCSRAFLRGTKIGWVSCDIPLWQIDHYKLSFQIFNRKLVNIENFISPLLIYKKSFRYSKRIMSWSLILCF